MRLIDADKFVLALMDASLSSVDEDTILDLVDSVHTVDAVPVVHGKWEFLGPNNLIKECMCGTCSVCKIRSKYIVNTALCPRCGAKMDGDG